MLGLIDTRGDRPGPVGREPLWLDLPELRPWRWYVAAAVLIAIADRIDGWPALIPLTVGIGCALHAVTGYARGNDGLSKYRQ
jgi:hypothetical protein